MASGFSLGAAIGATGKFPKLKQAEQDTAAQDRVAKELAAIRQGTTADRNKYHNVYVKEAGRVHSEAVQQMLQYEKNRDPERVSKVYDLDNKLEQSRRFLAIKSDDLFKIEDETKFGDQRGNYIPRYFNDLSALINVTANEDDLFQRIITDPRIPLIKQDDENYISKDGYVQIRMPKDGLKRIILTANKKYDFDKELSGNKVMDIDNHGTIIKEDKNVTDKERTIERYISVPKDREEAIELKKDNPEIDPNNNAWDLGKKWFMNNPGVRQQYRSILIENNTLTDGDLAMTDDNELYKKFYNQYVLTHIPAKQINKDGVFNRTVVNVNTADKVAPTSYSIGTFTTNYLGKDELYTEFGIAASKDSAGSEVDLPQTPYIVSLATGKPEFRGTATKKMTIARIGVYPATRVKDAETGKIILVPLSQRQKKEYDASGKKYLMYPFAIAVDKPLEIGVMPDLSKAAYAIPLYEPDAGGNFVIPADVRSSKNGKGSPLLNQIINKSKWDEESLANWTKAFFNMMKGVKDQNDIK